MSLLVGAAARTIIGLDSIHAVKSIPPEIEIWFKIPFHFNFHAERESDVKMFVSLHFENSEIAIPGCLNAWSLIPNYQTTPVRIGQRSNLWQWLIIVSY